MEVEAMNTAMDGDTSTQPPQQSMNDVENDTTSSTAAMACPLFMEGLPRNFAQNSQLAAIASLLEENVNEEEDATTTKPKTTQGVYQCVLNRHRNKRKTSSHQRNKPSVVKRSAAKPKSSYKKHQRTRPATKKKASTTASSGASQTQSNNNASIGETTLFLNMWKL